jgi:hypothetical protein
VSHKNFTYFSFYGRDLIVVFLVFYVHVHHRSRSKEIKNNHFWNYTGPPINLGYRAVGSSFWLGGAESEGRRPEEIFKFRVSEMPFPGPCSPPVATALGYTRKCTEWQIRITTRKSCSIFFFVRLFLHDIFLKFELLARYFFWDSTHPPIKNQMVRP